MIIPIRCYTCGEVLADKWIPYVTCIQNDKNASTEKIENENLELTYLDLKQKTPQKSIEGKILDELGLHKYCCRRMMLSNVHVISYLA
tara:strand:+ start:116 stop:379 length:264 start_codon:yes stop_codon:yes gene_type:complete